MPKQNSNSETTSKGTSKTALPTDPNEAELNLPPRVSGLGVSTALHAAKTAQTEAEGAAFKDDKQMVRIRQQLSVVVEELTRVTQQMAKRPRLGAVAPQERANRAPLEEAIV